MLHLKAKTKSEMATLLGISRSTFYRRLKNKKLKLPAGLLSPLEQNKILKAFGVMEKSFFFEGKNASDTK